MTQTKNRVEELEMQLAYAEYELLQWRTIANKHECGSASELDSFIDRIVWENQ